MTLPRLLRFTDDAFFSALGWKRTAQEFLFHLREGGRLRFFFHPRNRKDFFLNTLTRTQPLESILEEADDVLNDRFQALGSPLVFLGNPIPWRRDFKSGKEWPLKPSHKIDILDLDNPSDVKVPWELSRFHQTWWLGKASWLTGSPVYAEKFGSLVSDWIEKNPVGYGINWATAMEASIRACNWIAGYYFFCEAQALREEFWIRFLRSLLMHGLFIESHLEYSRANHNHFLSNVVGLLYLGIFFQDLPLGKRWLRWSVAQLQKEMEEQVYEDGVSYEKSTSYHRLVLELFTSAALLCRRNRIPLSNGFLGRLERMFESTMHYSRPDGSVPLFGDADDGRLFRIMMRQNINDHRHALCIGAVLFERSDFKQAAGGLDQETLWYFGGEGFETFQQLRDAPAPMVSRGFPLGGIYILRAPNVHMFVHAGNLGTRGLGKHAHHDTLGFELWAGGPLIVDSGTYAYSSDPEKRKQLRGTGSHNTIMVDGREIADLTTLWSVQNDRTNPRVLEWTTSDQRDVLRAEHHAYQCLQDPVIHRRTIDFLKDSQEIRLTDLLSGNANHLLQFRLHFHPGVSLSPAGGNRYIALSGTTRLQIDLSGKAEIFETLYSPSYGVLLRSKGLQIRLNAQLPFTFETHMTLKID